MLAVLTESVSNASFGIYMPRFTGTIYEVLSAPVSAFEVADGLCRRGGDQIGDPGLHHTGHSAAVRTVHIMHPFWTLAFLVLISITFSLFGFILGIWADGFEKLQVVPMMIITPLTFLGGTFYSIDMLPPIWQTVTLFNPIVYLVNGFRWAFYDSRRWPVDQLGMTFAIFVVCVAVVAWIFRTGYRLRT